MRSVQLLHLTDPHLFADPASELYGVNTAESLRRVLDAALTAGTRPDAVVVTGDIGDDLTAAAYEQFRRLLARCDVPVHCLPGNHDDPAAMARLLDDGRFRYCGHARLGGWGLVLLDSHVPGQPHGMLSAAELHRLDGDLGELADVPTVVAVHHPPVPVGSAWLDALGLSNADEFQAVVDRHPQVRIVLAGHVHQASETRRKGVCLLTTPSTCAQFAPRTERCVMDHRPPGYRWLRLVPDGSFDTRVDWLPALVGEPRAEDAAFR